VKLRASPMWLLVGGALVLRAGWVLYRWTHTGALLDYPDEELHWQLARNLVTRGALVTDDGRFAARMPVYPLFLAPFATLGTWGILAARLAQTLLGAATVGVAQAWAGSALGRRAALLVGVLVCLDPFGVFFANLLLTEVLFTLLAISFAACAWRVVDARNAGWSAWLGVAALGPLALMTRPSAAGWIPLAWGLIWLFARNRRRAAARLGICATVLAVALLPWGLRNQLVLGAPAWLSANGGLTLYDAQGPQADGSSDQSFLAHLPELAALGEIERDRLLQQRALEQMRSDPARVLRLAGVKLLRTWNPWPNVTSHRTGLAAWSGAIYTMGALVLAALGLGIAIARRKRLRSGAVRNQLWIWTPVLYFTLVHCVYIGSVRYRIPLMPFLALAAGCSALVREAASKPFMSSDKSVF
jgi:4-amino-4-deoxy-L-arabinose transferase-like glycosyltransferase